MDFYVPSLKKSFDTFHEAKEASNKNQCKEVYRPVWFTAELHDNTSERIKMSGRHAYIFIIREEQRVKKFGFKIIARKVYNKNRTYKRIIFGEQEYTDVCAEWFTNHQFLKNNNVFPNATNPLQVAIALSKGQHLPFTKEQIKQLKIALFPYLVNLVDDLNKLINK